LASGWRIDLVRFGLIGGLLMQCSLFTRQMTLAFDVCLGDYGDADTIYVVMVPIHYGFFKNKVCETRFLKLYFSNL